MPGFPTEYAFSMMLSEKAYPLMPFVKPIPTKRIPLVCSIPDTWHYCMFRDELKPQRIAA